MKQYIKGSAVFCTIFLWGYTLFAQPSITRVEYYIDNDPGYGNAVTVSISAGINLSNITQSIPVTTLKTGAHVLGIRAKDAKGVWSLDNKWLFLKTPSATSVTTIIKAEYYIDSDPGYGNANPVQITPGISLLNITKSIPVSALSSGAHLLGIRVKDANGSWSLDNKWIFIKTTSASAVPDIVKAEVYVDSDPGYDKAKAIIIKPGINLTNIVDSIDPSLLKDGAHVIGIRAKDANGAWSLDNKWLFVKETFPKPVPNLRQLECYIDTDPGYGKGIPVAINPVTSLPDFNLPVNVSTLTIGTHTLGIRSKDANGAWSLDNKFIFTMSSAITIPSILVNSVPSKVMCAGTAFDMSYHATGVNAGNIFTAQLSDSKGSFTNPQPAGSFAGTTSAIIHCKLPRLAAEGNGYKVRVVSSNPVLTGIAEADSIVIHKRPFVGNDTVMYFACREEAVSLRTVYDTTKYKYQWDTASIDHVGAGIYGLTVFDPNIANGCNDTVYVTVQQGIATWLGNISTDWHTAGNWSTGRVPDTSVNVIIKGSDKICVISTANGTAASIRILDQAILRVTNNKKIVLAKNCIPLPVAN